MRRCLMAIVGLSGLLAACGSEGDGFECASDDACVAGGIAGICQPNNYCSFPDPGCDSGQRYAEHAPAGFAEECVPSEVASSGSSGGSTSETTSDPTQTTTQGVTQPEAPACVDVELGSELGSVDVRTLAARGDDFSPSCADDTGPDVAYWWTAPVAGEYDFTGSGSDGFTSLTIQLLDACDSELRCVEGLATWPASVRHSLDRGDSVIVVVDGDDGEDAMFELSIALVTG